MPTYRDTAGAGNLLDTSKWTGNQLPGTGETGRILHAMTLTTGQTYSAGDGLELSTNGQIAVSGTATISVPVLFSVPASLRMANGSHLTFGGAVTTAQFSAAVIDATGVTTDTFTLVFSKPVTISSAYFASLYDYSYTLDFQDDVTADGPFEDPKFQSDVLDVHFAAGSTITVGENVQLLVCTGSPTIHGLGELTVNIAPWSVWIVMQAGGDTTISGDLIIITTADEDNPTDVFAGIGNLIVQGFYYPAPYAKVQGTLNVLGQADIPTEADVRKGIAFWNGTKTGTRAVVRSTPISAGG